MEYKFPNEGYENIKDQFMLGKKYLVAPVLTEADERIITLPRGKLYCSPLRKEYNFESIYSRKWTQ